MKLKEKIERVRSRIEQAAARAGRRAGDIRLMGVTKGVDASRISEAIESGLTLFGENRVEEAAEKISLFPQAQWHLIGHLQGRKVKSAIPLFSLIQSVDTLKLIENLDRQAALQGRRARALLEVNVSGEASKYGFSEGDLPQVFSVLQKHPAVEIKGLMTMAPLNSDPEAARPVFRKLRALFERIGGLEILSMGMSQDFEVAVEEGATLVRVGRAIFGD